MSFRGRGGGGGGFRGGRGGGGFRVSIIQKKQCMKKCEAK